MQISRMAKTCSGTDGQPGIRRAEHVDGPAIALLKTNHRPMTRTASGFQASQGSFAACGRSVNTGVS